MHALIVDEPFINIRVAYPLQVTSKNGEQYLKYGIEIETNDPSFTIGHSRTWRRYSDFRELRKLLLRNNLNVEVPVLPSQGIFQDREHPSFIESRRDGLENFLKQLLAIPLYKAERALHLFVQTSLSLEDIVGNLEGTRHDSIDATASDLPWSSMTTNNNIRTDLQGEEMTSSAENINLNKQIDEADNVKQKR